MRLHRPGSDLPRVRLTSLGRLSSGTRAPGERVTAPALQPLEKASGLRRGR